MPNQTFFIQLVIFLFTFISLNFLVFQPVLRIIAKRRELTQGAEKEAAQLDAKTEGMIESYTHKIQSARNQGLSQKEKFRKEGETQASEILKKAHQEMETALEATRQELLSQSKEAQLALKKYSRDLSQEMAEKLLGRKVVTE